jgi:hypothetical protein
MNWLKEVYLSVFVLFFRIGRNSWSFATNAAKGAAGITWLQFMLLIALTAWLYYFTGNRRLVSVSNPVLLALFGVTYLINYYILVAREAGTRFESAFTTLGHRHRFVLVAASVAFVLFSFGLALFSGYYVHANGPMHP